MFNTISWQEFLSTVTVIAGGYYIVTALLLYGSEIKNIFKQKEPKLIAAEISGDQNDSTESNDLMGRIKYEAEVNVPHESIVESDEINITQLNESEEPIQSRDPLIDSFKELQNEIEIIAEGLTPNNREGLLLFEPLLLRYPQLLQTPYEEEIIRLVCKLIFEKLSEHSEPNEIKSWWTEVVTSAENHQ